MSPDMRLSNISVDEDRSQASMYFMGHEAFIEFSVSYLQSVLQMLMSSGSMNKLPDNLQWQIRTLLPKKDSKSQALPLPEPVPAPVEVTPQQGFAGPHCPSPINLAAASLQLPLPAQVCFHASPCTRLLLQASILILMP